MEVKAVVWLAKSLGVLLVVAGIYFWISGAIESYGDRRVAVVQKKFEEEKRHLENLAATAAENERVKGAIHAKELADQLAQLQADMAVANAAAAGARSELQRVRNTNDRFAKRLVQACQGDTTGPGIDALAAVSGELFGQCQTELVGLGEQAEGLATRLRGLQAWARSAVRLCGADDAETSPDK